MLKLVLSSVSKGTLFTSTFAALEGSEVPTILLPDSHPFAKLWRDHLMLLSQPGQPFQNVVDALLAIALGNPSWKQNAPANDIESLQTEMRNLLAENPPNIVVVTGLGKKAYGFHFRESGLWPFIGISHEFIQLWMMAEEGSDSKLGLTALLSASLNHEIAHWIQTLRFGFLRDEKKRTLKLIYPPWTPWLGEAGSYVEVTTQGGIIEYSTKTNKAYLLVGSDLLSNVWPLPTSYLRTFLDPTSSLLYKPGDTKPNVTFDSSSKIYFPFEDDNCKPTHQKCLKFL